MSASRAVSDRGISVTGGRWGCPQDDRARPCLGRLVSTGSRAG